MTKAEVKKEMALADAYNAIAKLEKENAELKEMYHESDEDNNKLRENIPLLTEAKELLQKCLNTYLRDPELRNEVERFLKEGK